MINTKPGPDSEGKYDVWVKNGIYQLRYKEMSELASGIAVGTAVYKGDFLGYPMETKENKGAPSFGMIHWELAISNSDTYAGDRLCPLTYFDAQSRSRIEAIWSKTPLWTNDNMRSQFPEICNGYYHNHVEPNWVIQK